MQLDQSGIQRRRRNLLFLFVQPSLRHDQAHIAVNISTVGHGQFLFIMLSRHEFPAGFLGRKTGQQLCTALHPRAVFVIIALPDQLSVLQKGQSDAGHFHPGHIIFTVIRQCRTGASHRTSQQKHGRQSKEQGCLFRNCSLFLLHLTALPL